MACELNDPELSVKTIIGAITNILFTREHVSTICLGSRLSAHWMKIFFPPEATNEQSFQCFTRYSYCMVTSKSSSFRDAALGEHVSALHAFIDVSWKSFSEKMAIPCLSDSNRITRWSTQTLLPGSNFNNKYVTVSNRNIVICVKTKAWLISYTFLLLTQIALIQHTWCTFKIRKMTWVCLQKSKYKLKW